MLPEVAALTPTQRMAAGRCPECGVSLTGLDVLSHRDNHWPERALASKRAVEAKDRYKLLTDYATAHKAKE